MIKDNAKSLGLCNSNGSHDACKASHLSRFDSERPFECPPAHVVAPTSSENEKGDVVFCSTTITGFGPAGVLDMWNFGRPFLEAVFIPTENCSHFFF